MKTFEEEVFERFSLDRPTSETEADMIREQVREDRMVRRVTEGVIVELERRIRFGQMEIDPGATA